jgi:hypothetical protein
MFRTPVNTNEITMIAGDVMTAEKIVRAMVRLGAPLDREDICMWCEECPDEPAEEIAVAGGSPVYEQAQWHSPACPWRLAHELLDQGAEIRSR